MTTKISRTQDEIDAAFRAAHEKMQNGIRDAFCVLRSELGSLAYLLEEAEAADRAQYRPDQAWSALKKAAPAAYARFATSRDVASEDWVRLNSPIPGEDGE